MPVTVSGAGQPVPVIRWPIRSPVRAATDWLMITW